MLTARQMLNKDYDEATRQRLIKAARLLQTGTPGKGIQKEEIAEAIGVSGEREARAYVSALKKKLPVISHNGYKGFRIARTAADVADNERTFLEVLSRVEEMLYGILPNLAFEQKKRSVLCSARKVNKRLFTGVGRAENGSIKNQLKGVSKWKRQKKEYKKSWRTSTAR